LAQKPPKAIKQVVSPPHNEYQDENDIN